MAQPSFYWSEVSDSATYTATDTLAGTDVDSVQFATEDKGWRPANTTGTKAIVIDNGSPLTVDALLLLGESIDGVTLEIRGSTDNFSSSDVQVSAGAALSTDLNAAIRRFTESTFRYWKLNFSGFSSDFEVLHVALDSEVLLPFFETDPDENNVTPDANHLVSKGKLYLGSWQNGAERIMPLDFGEVTASELASLVIWSDANIKTVNPFFMCIDTDTTKVFFGRLQAGGAFSAPLEIGVHVVKPQRFLSRAV